MKKDKKPFRILQSSLETTEYGGGIGEFNRMSRVSKILFVLAFSLIGSKNICVAGDSGISCARAMKRDVSRNLAIQSKVLFFPGYGFSTLLKVWKARLQMTWTTALLLEESGLFIDNATNEALSEEAKIEAKSRGREGMSSFFHRYFESTSGEWQESGVIEWLDEFNRNAFDRGTCFNPCIQDGFVRACTRKALAKLMISEGKLAHRIRWLSEIKDIPLKLIKEGGGIGDESPDDIYLDDIE